MKTMAEGCMLNVRQLTQDTLEIITKFIFGNVESTKNSSEEIQ